VAGGFVRPGAAGGCQATDFVNPQGECRSFSAESRSAPGQEPQRGHKFLSTTPRQNLSVVLSVGSAHPVCYRPVQRQMSGSLSKLTESLSERLLFREERVGIGVLVVRTAWDLLPFVRLSRGQH
jgi:hypothetical protein